jgi:hypothetical protein
VDVGVCGWSKLHPLHGCPLNCVSSSIQDLLSKLDEIEACVMRIQLASEHDDPLTMAEEQRKVGGWVGLQTHTRTHTTHFKTARSGIPGCYEG